MLIKKDILRQIKAGDITLAFRKWKRPTVKTGGTLRTALGVLAIEEVEPVTRQQITETDAKRAGSGSKASLLTKLNSRDEGTIYRIKLHYKSRDPRKELREDDDLSIDELIRIAQKLEKIDQRSYSEPWTYTVLLGIRQHPGMRAGDLSVQLNVKKSWLKRNVRKLKEMGLTISLSPGYQLSPRGEVVVEYLEK